MLKQQGRVLEQSRGVTTVLLGPAAGCPVCAAGKGCGAGIFGRWLQPKPVQLRLTNPAGAQAGDVVIVGITEALFLRLVMRLYMRPLLLAIAAAGLGNYLATRMTKQPGIIDGFSLLLGVTGAGLGMAWSRGSGRERSELEAGEMLHVLSRVQASQGCSAQQVSPP